jgi:Glycogen synthase
VRDEVPLVGMVTRLDWQKGIDILGHVLHLLLNGGAGEAQFVVVGTGANHYEDMLRHLAGYHTQKMRAVLAYAPDVAPLVYGGSDLFLMPSLFEPCGLGQMIAMRYGSVPVGYRARIRNHGHSCFLCEIVIRSQFHTTYEPEA